ncbi:TonB-dependent siderophore receptor [Acidomonas methanolica]|uniref:Outer membrane siderophore receptor n=1 Tax=Acidomonas methanolica NBRC 104435 TaxID=1231351 RepID=A0A023D9H6_ACIMT|nr:TonB-dependent siderophore receptor [Acidomonas methanolica]TCS31756.1 iron complex outermembrane receptor protein [Acidomonas methanolica]GAJ30476.1 outer membrane siderophore receptor [Acidomonas methanolica NBRC 104435]GBQ51498.1 outer membrane siderophore receptor [Acidomonas methanolica]GEL00448.1 ligand-gated channel [Acidomonas methanolica NBRC 104435]
MTAHERHRGIRSLSRLYAFALLTGSCLAGPGVRAAEGPIAPSPPAAIRHFSIPAQPLQSALQAYLRQTGVQVAYPTAEARAVSSATVTGDFTPQEGLSRLLNGTGLTYRFTSANSAMLGKASSAITLGPVRVGGTVRSSGGDAQSAYGPGVGFVATRSASATRTDTPLIETPKSVYVVTRKQMDDLQPLTIGAALRYTPGVVSLSSNDSTPSASLFQPVHQRGFESYTFVDGLLNGTSVSDPFFLDRIEALSGPSSVMYGQANPGGLINMTLKRPTERAQGQANVGFGNYDRYEGQVDFSGPLNKSRTLLYRLIGVGITQGSQTRYNHYKRLAAQGDLEWKIDRKTDLTIIGQFSYDPQSWSPWIGVPAYGSLIKSPTGRIPVSTFYGDPAFNENWDREYMLEAIFHHEFTRNLQFNMTARFDAQSGGTCSLMAGAVNIARNTIARSAFCNSHIGGRSSQMTANLSYKLRTGPVSHSFLVGVDYRGQWAKGNWAFATAPAASITNPIYNQYTYVDYFQATNGKSRWAKYAYWQDGIYFQDQIKWRRFYVTLAGRQDWNGYGTLFNRPFTWNAGINYVSSIGLAPYFNYAKSFMPQIGKVYSAGNIIQPDPLNGHQWEVGLKYQIPHTQSLLTAAYYDLAENNVLVSNPDFPQYSSEIGQVRSKGVEFSAHANLAQGLDLILNYTWNRVYNSRTTLTGQTIGGQTVSLAGKRLVQQPTNAASGLLDYTLPKDLVPGLSVNFGVRYQGKSWADQANSFRNPSFILFDMGFSWDAGQVFKSAKGLNVRLSMTNFANNTYVQCGSARFCHYGDQRIAYGTIGYHF